MVLAPLVMLHVLNPLVRGCLLVALLIEGIPKAELNTLLCRFEVPFVWDGCVTPFFRIEGRSVGLSPSPLNREFLNRVPGVLLP